MGAPTPMLTPQPPRRRRSQQGLGTRTSISRTPPRAFASLGPASRAQAPRAAQGGAERSDGPNGCPIPVGSLLYAPGARRARGGMRVGARMPRNLTRRGCPSGARSAKRVPRRTPKPPRRRLPLRTAKGSQTGGRASDHSTENRPGIKNQSNETRKAADSSLSKSASLRR